LSYVEPGELVVLNLGGGIVDGPPISSLQDTQSPYLRNVYPYGSGLARRGGLTKVNTLPANANIVSVFPFKESDGTYTLIVGMEDRFGRLDHAGVADIPFALGLSVASQALPWVFKQYQDTVYACRRNDGSMKRGGPTGFMGAGIAAPTVAPVLADGGAGDIIAGNYYAVYTWYNPATGNESNPSPPSALYAAPGGKMIDWSSVTTSPNPQVGARRLYRVSINQTDAYYLIGMIDDNIVDVYVGDNVLSADMGRMVSFDNGAPPSNVINMELWHERLFTTDGRDLYHSEVGRPECFGLASIHYIFPDDGHEIRALHAFGDMLLVGKTNKIHYLTGSTEFDIKTLSGEHGCVAGMSMKSAEGQVFWFAGDNVYRSDGATVQSISTYAIRNILDAIPKDQWEKVTAEIYPRLGWYVLSVPSGTGVTDNTLELVFDYKTAVWTVFEHVSPAPAAMHLGDMYDADYTKMIYASYPGSKYIYHWNEGLTDDGSLFTASYRTRAIGTQGRRIMMRRVRVLCSTVGGSLTLSVFEAGAAAPFKTRVVSLFAPQEYKPYLLSTFGEPRHAIQIQMDYTGKPHWKLDEYVLEYGTMKRIGLAR
jgi:hypothetical protein